MKVDADRQQWTVLELLKVTEQYLSEKKVDSPRVAAELLLGHLLGMKRIQLYVEYDRPVTLEEKVQLREYVRRAAQQEPLQYITGETDFYDFTLAVAPGVLIPRPETEGLVELVLQELEAETPRRLLDMGTGSGCIAIALARHLPETTRITALDNSPRAIAQAQLNIGTHNLQHHIELMTASAFELPEKQSWDVIVSNPPYIAEDERDTLLENVLAYEPETALFDGGDGLSFYRLLSEKPPLLDDGVVFCELPAPAAEKVEQLFRRSFEEVTVKPDLAGRTRYLIAREWRDKL
jgi:release factor glutamine methyltransferase